MNDEFMLRKLTLLVKKHSIDMHYFSVNEALECALLAEEYKKKVGPFDVAFEHFAQQQTDYENIAIFMERIETSPDSELKERMRQLTF